MLDVLVPRFSEELIATPAAEARLANWFALHRPPYSRRTIGRDLVLLLARSEHTALIVSLDDAKAAVSIATRWRAAAFDPPHVSANVNQMGREVDVLLLQAKELTLTHPGQHGRFGLPS